MYKDKGYFSGIACGLKSIGIGLKTTMREFFTKKITEQYPENRKELVMFDRFRGALTMPHNEKNEHKCVACGICQMQCPNDTINVVSEMQEVDGRKKKVLVRYEYDLGSCMFCMLCTNACPHNAITFDQSFENAVFDRNKLHRVLNQPGSKVEEKPKKPVAAAVRPVAKTVSAEVKADVAPAKPVSAEPKPEAVKPATAPVEVKPATQATKPEAASKSENEQPATAE